MRMFLIVLIVTVVTSPAWSAKIQFPDEELARESVLPKFDDSEAVKNRAVTTDKKLEPSLMLAWTLNDAFTEPLSFGGLLTYHINETHGVQLYGMKFSEEKNEYPDQILEDTGADIRETVAIPKSVYVVAYQNTPFYGKVSITKQNVVNLAMYGNLGIGQIQIDDDSEMAYSFGIGTKLYFNSKLSLRVDYRFLYYDARNQIRTDYDGGYQLNSILGFGLGYLLF